MTEKYGSAWPIWYFGIRDTPIILNNKKSPAYDIKIIVEKPGFYFGIPPQNTTPLETAEQFIARLGKTQV